MKAQGNNRKRVVAVVRNPGTIDNRVIKTSVEAAKYGVESILLGRQLEGFESREVHQGVSIFRVAPLTEKRPTLLRLLDQQEPESSLYKYLSDIDSINLSEIDLGSVIPTESLGVRLFEFSYSFAQKVYRKLKPFRYLVPVAIQSQVKRTIIKVATSRWCRRTIRPVIKRVIRGDRDRLRVYLAEGFFEFAPKLYELKPDIIHAHELSALLPCVVVGKKLNVPVIYDSHELEFARNSPWSDEGFQVWHEMEKSLIAEVDSVIAVSSGCGASLVDRYLLDEVSIVRNCPPLFGELSKETVRDVVNVADECPLLIFVGKVTTNRGLEMTLDALKELPGYHLACVGPEDPKFRAKLDLIVEENSIGNRVHFVPAVKSVELVDFIKTADVSIVVIRDSCLSYHYCLPNKLFESVHAGIPMVVSDLPDMSDFVRKYETGEVFKGEGPLDLAAKIKLVYENRASYFDDQKVRLIREENCAEGEIRKICQIYDNLIERM